MAAAIIWEVSPTVQCPQICHCTAAKGPCNLAVPGRITQEGSGEIATASPRLHPKGTSSRFALRAPRRFAPRNDKSEAITILTAAGTDWKCAAGPGCPLPCGGLVKLPAFRFQVSTCRSPAFYFLCFANRNAPMRADRGTARITPTELAMACTISTEKNVPLMSWENDGSSDER